MRAGRQWRVSALAAALSLSVPAGAQERSFNDYRALVATDPSLPPAVYILRMRVEPDGEMVGNLQTEFALMSLYAANVRGVTGRNGCMLIMATHDIFQGKCSAQALVGNLIRDDGRQVQVRFEAIERRSDGPPIREPVQRVLTSLGCRLPSDPLLAGPGLTNARALVDRYDREFGRALEQAGNERAAWERAMKLVLLDSSELIALVQATGQPRGPDGRSAFERTAAEIANAPIRVQAKADAERATLALYQKLPIDFVPSGFTARQAAVDAIAAADAEMAERVRQLPPTMAGAAALVAALDRAVPSTDCSVPATAVLVEAVRRQAPAVGPDLPAAIAAAGASAKDARAVRALAQRIRTSGIFDSAFHMQDALASLEAEATRRDSQQQASAKAAEQAKTSAAIAQLQAARQRGPLDVDLAAAYTNAFWDAHGPQKKVLVDAGILSKGADYVMLDLVGQAAAQMGTSAFFNYKEVWSFAATDVRCTPRSATVSVCTYKVGWEIDVEQPGSNIMKAVGMGQLDRTVRSQLNDAMGQPLKEVTDTFTKTASGWTSPAIGKRMAFLYGRADSMRGALSRSGASGPKNPKTGTDICKSLAAGVLAGGGDMSGPAGRLYEGAGC